MDFWLLVLTSALASGILTNLSGWLMSSLKDWKIDDYEWSRGFYTLVFCAVTTGSLVLTGINPVAAAAYSVPIHMLINSLKSIAGIQDAVPLMVASQGASKQAK